MLKFNNDTEAKEYGVQQNFSKYHFEEVLIADEKVILCGTCIPYEDEFYPFADQMLSKFNIHGDAAELRDMFIEAFEKYGNCRFLDVYDTF